MAAAYFDLGRLYESVVSQRERSGLSWGALSREVGVAVATIRRLGHADDAEADGVLALIRWLDVAPEDFMGVGRVDGQRLPTSDGCVVRVDMALVAAAAGDDRGARGRARTTIQRLAMAAQRSGQSVASLTRLSEV